MKRKLTITGIVIGAILALGPFWGMIATVFGMQRAFETLGGPGISDPRELSSNIHAVLLIPVLSFIACPVGLGVLIFCIIKLQTLRRQPPPFPPP